MLVIHCGPTLWQLALLGCISLERQALEPVTEAAVNGILDKDLASQMQDAVDSIEATSVEPELTVKLSNNQTATSIAEISHPAGRPFAGLEFGQRLLYSLDACFRDVSGTDVESPRTMTATITMADGTFERQLVLGNVEAELKITTETLDVYLFCIAHVEQERRKRWRLERIHRAIEIVRMHTVSQGRF